MNGVSRGVINGVIRGVINRVIRGIFNEQLGLRESSRGQLEEGLEEN